MCGLRVFMVHNKKFIPKDLGETDLVIYGHSHKYEDKEMEGIRFLNPGSCGPRRFHQEITLALVYVEDGSRKFRIEKIDIPHPDVKAAEPKEVISADIGEKLPRMMKDIGSGKDADQLAKKYRISKKLAEQIIRMYVTHPGVDAEGIMRRIGF